MRNSLKQILVIILIYMVTGVSNASTLSSPVIPVIPKTSMWSNMQNISGTLSYASAYPQYNSYKVSYNPYQTPMIYTSPWAVESNNYLTVPALSSFGMNGYIPTSPSMYNSGYGGTLFGGSQYSPDYAASYVPSYLPGDEVGVSSTTSGLFTGTTHIDFSQPTSLDSSVSSVLYPGVKPWGSPKPEPKSTPTRSTTTPKSTYNNSRVRVYRPKGPSVDGTRNGSRTVTRSIDEQDLKDSITRLPDYMSRVDEICDENKIPARSGYSFKDYSSVFDIRMTENLSGVTTNMDFFKKVLCPLAKKLKNSDLTYRQRINIYAWLVAKIHQNYRRYGTDGDVYNIDYLWGGDLYDKQGGNGFYPKTSSRTSGCRGNCGEQNHAFPTVGYDCSGYVFSVYKPILSNSVFSYRDVATSYKKKGREVLPTQSMSSSFVSQVKRNAKPGDVFVSNGHIAIYGIDPVTGAKIVMENGYKISSLEAWTEKNRKMGGKYKVMSAFDKNDRPYTWGQPDAFMEDVIKRCK